MTKQSHSSTPDGAPMGTPANGFCKPRLGDAKPREVTVREPVTKYGDEWRLMVPGHHFIKREHMESETSDTWDGLHMTQMERGKRPRIRLEDTYDE